MVRSTSVILFVFSTLTYAVAFMPNYVFQFALKEANQTVADSFDGSYTHKDIIREASLRSVARLFERLNPAEILPGKLTGLDPLTPGTLFGAVYGGGNSSSLTFEEALDQIEMGAAQVDQNPDATSSSEARKHFDDEKIREGHGYLRKKRADLIAVLLAEDDDNDDDDRSNASSANIRTARRLLGECLLTLQDFYSHTNYVELGRNVPIRGLGVVPAENVEDLNAISKAHKAACTSCPVSLIWSKCGKEPLCDDNVIKTKLNRLTSGYFVYPGDGKDKVKPAGKCSHGAYADSSRMTPPTGGINKSTKNCKESPHFHLHEKAVELARRATESFLENVRETVGDKKFNKLFGLTTIYEKGISLCFVVDTSGSMHNDIASVARRIEQIVQSGRKASRFVLVPFKDHSHGISHSPPFGPAFVAKTPEAFRDAIDGLRASGGGDCPELALHGLRLALQTCDRRSSIYVFTDASAKDVELKNEIMSLIEETKSRITFFYTGLSGRPPCGESAAATLYEQISRRSSGQVLTISKAQVATSTVVSFGETGPLSATLLNQVHALKEKTLRRIFIVDCTLASVTISIASEKSVVVTVTDPRGNAWSKTNSFVGRVFENPTVGVWTLEVEAQAQRTEVSVLVVAATHVDIFDTFVDLDGRAGHPGLFPSQGRPLEETKIKIVISVTGIEEIDEITRIDVVGLDGKVIQRKIGFERGELTSRNTFGVSFTSPSKPFQLKVAGNAKCGGREKSFQRISSVFQPESVRVNPKKDPNGTFDVEFVTTIDTNVTATFDDPDGFGKYEAVVLDSPALTENRRRRRQSHAEKKSFSVTAFVKVGQKLVVKITPIIPPTAEIGSVGTITVEASTSNGDSINSATVDIPAVPLVLDEDPPVCVVMSHSGGNCDGLTTRTCAERTWSLIVDVTDDGVGLKTVRGLEDEIDVSSEFQHLKDSKKRESVKATVGCCQRRATIQATDSVGNRVNCSTINLQPLPNFISPPTVVPSTSPTVVPSTSPTVVPSTSPTVVPSTSPTVVPSTSPTVVPSTSPTVVPSTSPTVVQPTSCPPTRCESCGVECIPGEKCSDGFRQRFFSLLWQIAYDKPKFEIPPRNETTVIDTLYRSFLLHSDTDSSEIRRASKPQLCRLVRVVRQRDACAEELCPCFFSKPHIDDGLLWDDWSSCLVNFIPSE